MPVMRSCGRILDISALICFDFSCSALQPAMLLMPLMYIYIYIFEVVGCVDLLWEFGGNVGNAESDVLYIIIRGIQGCERILMYNGSMVVNKVSRA